MKIDLYNLFNYALKLIASLNITGKANILTGVDGIGKKYVSKLFSSTGNN